MRGGDIPPEPAGQESVQWHNEQDQVSGGEAASSEPLDIKNKEDSICADLRSLMIAGLAAQIN